jgi:hypothetical protein
MVVKLGVNLEHYIYADMCIDASPRNPGVADCRHFAEEVLASARAVIYSKMSMQM